MACPLSRFEFNSECGNYVEANKKRFRKRRPHNQREVVEVAEEEWDKLTWKRTYGVIDGMPRRVKAVINAEEDKKMYLCMSVDG